MKKYIVAFIMLALTSLLFMNCGKKNIYSDLSSPSITEDSQYEDAKKALNAGDYVTAITKILSLSSSYQSQTDVKMTLASAYAGRCGLDLLKAANGLSSSTGSIFSIMLNMVKTVSVNPADCLKAEKIIQSFGTYAQRTTDQNMFLFFLSLVKGGAYLKAKIDTNGDGAQDTANNVCYSARLLTERDDDHNGSNDAAQLNADGTVKSDMENIITAFGLALENSIAVSASALGSSGAALTAIQTTCVSACVGVCVNTLVAACINTCMPTCQAANPGWTNAQCQTSCQTACPSSAYTASCPSSACTPSCSTDSFTNETAISTPLVAIFRSILNSQSFGIGTCTSSSVETCCP